MQRRRRTHANGSGLFGARGAARLDAHGFGLSAFHEALLTARLHVDLRRVASAVCHARPRS